MSNSYCQADRRQCSKAIRLTAISNDEIIILDLFMCIMDKIVAIICPIVCINKERSNKTIMKQWNSK